MPVRKLYFTKNVYFDILESMLHFYFLQKFDFKKIVAKIFTHGRRILLIFSIQTYVKNLWALNWFHVANLQCYKNNENQNRIHQWNERSNFGQNISSMAQLWQSLFFYHTQSTIIAFKICSKFWFLALKWAYQFWPKCQLIGAALKKYDFYHTQNTIVALKTFSKSWFLALKWTYQFWPNCQSIGAALKKSAFYHIQNMIVALKTFWKSWFLALKWTYQFWPKCQLMGAALKKSAFYHSQNTIVALYIAIEKILDASLYWWNTNVIF